MKPKRTVIIGLDGVPLQLLEDLVKSSVMPNMQRIIQNGLLKSVFSTIPEISSVAWSSIITGQNPGQHGIFGFTELVADSYRLKFPNFSDLKSLPFWDLSKGKSIILNVPSTYPVRAMNGVHTSGFVSVDMRKSVHPASLLGKLKELDYRLDVDSQKAHNNLGMFIEDLEKTLAGRIKTYRYLWDYTDWETFMLVFTGTDRLMHFLWDAYEDKNHKHHRDFIEHFHKIDEAIGQINENINEDDTLILLSDHGFERLDKDIYINRFLMQQGFLVFAQGTEPNWSNIDFSTKAFALDPARIYINLKDKYPKGSVGPEQKNGLINELEKLFNSLEVDGRKVINRVHRREDIYSGPHVEDASELVLIANEGFNLKAAMASNELSSRGIFTGKHTYQGAFLLLNNKDLAAELPDEASVIDVGKLIQNLVKTR